MADSLDWNDDKDPEPDRDPLEEGGVDHDPMMFSGSRRPDDANDLSTADLEDAYLRALEAIESADWAVPAEEGELESVTAETQSQPVDSPSPESAGVEIARSDFLSGSVPAKHTAAESSVGAAPLDPAATAPIVDASIKPLRVIEACLFVGGHPLSAKKLANLLDGHNEPGDIEVLIDDLNQEYAGQGRPYEIRLVDGGYKLTLRAEFEAIRGRVYGVGPRDVKLSQDVLEVLALVAYQQPISPAAIEACKPNSANLLRQLLRRELVSLNRIDQSRNGVEYSTTQRFLQLFGLGQLNELPHPEDLSVR